MVPFLLKFRTFASVLMSLAWFLSVGGHLALLQGIAWTTMVHDFSRSGSLSEAVCKTFDGHHLCPLCKKIAKARSHEEHVPVSVKAEKKAMVFVLQSDTMLPRPICRDHRFALQPTQCQPKIFSELPEPIPKDLFS